jgi:hypothetical protein
MSKGSGNCADYYPWNNWNQIVELKVHCWSEQAKAEWIL